MHEARPLPEIVRDVESLRERHAGLLAATESGAVVAARLDELAVVDSELLRFDDMCRRTTTHHLMSAGLRWNDELRHPCAGSDVARVRTRDVVAFRGAETTILEATRMLASANGAGGPVAMADWTGPRGIRLGTALGLEHPASPIETRHDAQPSLF